MSKALAPDGEPSPSPLRAAAIPSPMLPPQIAVAINFVTHGSSLMHPEDHLVYCDDEGIRDFETLHPDLHPAHEFAFREACALLAYYFRSHVPEASREQIRAEHRDFVSDKVSLLKNEGDQLSLDDDVGEI